MREKPLKTPLISSGPKKFSFFDKGKINYKGVAVPQRIPLREETIGEIARIIRENKALKEATLKVRKEANNGNAGKAKILYLPHATFSCTCTERNQQGVKEESGYVQMDMDYKAIAKAFPDKNIEDAIEHLKSQIIGDHNLQHTLVFVSPSGKGLKDIVYVGDRQGLTHKEAFAALENYFAQRFGVKVDPATSNIVSTCFLCHDPNCWLNPKYESPVQPDIDLALWYKDSLPPAKPATNNFRGARPSYQNKGGNIFEIAKKWVEKHMLFTEGHRNTYIFRWSCILCEHAVTEQEAENEALIRFGGNPGLSNLEIKNTVHSAYKTATFGCKS